MHFRGLAGRHLVEFERIRILYKRAVYYFDFFLYPH